MKVLLVNDYPTPTGGAEIQMLMLCVMGCDGVGTMPDRQLHQDG